MNCCLASYSRGQMKIQQMAFVLVAIMIFFSMVGLFYFSIKTRGLEKSAEDLREQESLEIVKKISGTSEFSWTASDCASCIDFDKVLALKDRKGYEGFWQGIPYIQVVRGFTKGNESRECDKINYPNCNTITIVKDNGNYITNEVFSALCRFEPSKGGYIKCELGRIIMGFRTG